MSSDNIMLAVTAVLLTALNVSQFVFWSKHTQKLVDKLMSRNYAEYSQVNASSQASTVPRDNQDGFNPDSEDFRSLSDIGI